MEEFPFRERARRMLCALGGATLESGASTSQLTLGRSPGHAAEPPNLEYGASTVFPCGGKQRGVVNPGSRTGRRRRVSVSLSRPRSWAQGMRSGTPFGVPVCVGAVFRGCSLRSTAGSFPQRFHGMICGCRGRPKGTVWRGWARSGDRLENLSHGGSWPRGTNLKICPCREGGRVPATRCCRPWWTIVFG